MKQWILDNEEGLSVLAVWIFIVLYIPAMLWFLFWLHSKY